MGNAVTTTPEMHSSFHARGGILPPMAQPSTAARTPGFSTFLASSLVAGNAAAMGKGVLLDDGLEDDVAHIRPESAMKSRGLAGQSVASEIPDADSVAANAPQRKPPRSERNPRWKRSAVAPGTEELTIFEVKTARQDAARNLKRASITIRLSVAECARLKARAAESGLTVSEYLRSCTLEVESLRAQVKETLARMRAPDPAEKKAPAIEKPSLFGRVTQIWPRSRGDQRAASHETENRANA